MTHRHRHCPHDSAEPAWAGCAVGARLVGPRGLLAHPACLVPGAPKVPRELTALSFPAILSCALRDAPGALEDEQSRSTPSTIGIYN